MEQQQPAPQQQSSFGEDFGEIPEPSLIAQWFWRVVIALGIAFVLHWSQGSSNVVTPPSGHRLVDEEDWKPKKTADETAPAQGRSALLDKLEKETNNDTGIYDDIEVEDEDVSGAREADAEVEKCPAPPLEEDKESSSETEDECIPAPPSVRSRRPPPVPVSPAPQVPPIKARDGHHPGLDGFRRWYDVEASLFRIYTVGRTDDVPVVPAFIPKSERGQVALKIRVQNNYRRTISCYWVDYRGNEVHRSILKSGQTFHQTTWIGHPWVFRETETGDLLCHYIPYKVIPTTKEVPTVDDDEPEVGIHEFSIVSLGQRRHLIDEGEICFIEDKVFPTYMLTTQDAAAWSFQEMSRLNYLYIDTLTKYLTNIVLHPAETKYRQIRIAHPKFSQQVWMTPARGILLASGFVEEGAYAELGSAAPLLRERVQEISTLLFYVEQWKKIQGIQDEQPKGADGYGRANFGRRGPYNGV